MEVLLVDLRVCWGIELASELNFYFIQEKDNNRVFQSIGVSYVGVLVFVIYIMTLFGIFFVRSTVAGVAIESEFN